jgi:hypothetical protein
MDRYYIVTDNAGTRDILKLPGAKLQEGQALNLENIEAGEARMLAERLDQFIKDYPELRKAYLEYRDGALATAERHMTGGEYLAYRTRKMAASVLKRLLS